MTCECGEKADSLKTIVYKGHILHGCDKCLPSKTVKGTELNAKFEREYQKVKYRKDLLQVIEPREYIKAYGVNKAREQGFTDEAIRKYS